METSGPRSVGIIMDGNRRWAKERGLSSLEGHKRGFDKVRDLCSWVKTAGIEEVILYAFSTENWNRSPEEVAYLLNIFENAFSSTLKEIHESGFKMRFIGERHRFSEKLQEKMESLEYESAEGINTFAVALSYGGRAEILSAVNRLLAEGKNAIDEVGFKEAMWSAGLLDPDLIIRTGGDKRLSNFLTWQSAYSELFFTETKWPDFSKEEFDSIIFEFSQRERRHGK